MKKVSIHYPLQFFRAALVMTLLIMASCSSNSQLNTESDQEEETLITPQTAAEVIKDMATGVNIGNTFDIGIQSTDPQAIYPLIDLYAGAGMKNVRFPVTWMDGYDGNTLSDSSGNVNFEHPRFLELKQVIEYALSKDLYVVINAHHERWFKNNYDGSEKFDSAFRNLWTNIAEHFKDYPQELIFELLNEPEGKFGHIGGEVDISDPQALAFTRKIYHIGHQAVRETGGNNAHRIIMVSTNAKGNHKQLKSVYPTKESLPGSGNDPYLAAQVHTYDPWPFCGQNGSNANYPGSDAIMNSVKDVGTHARSLGLPVNYGEYGVGRSGNGEERDTDLVRGFYRLIKETTESENMSNTAWDDRGWFGLVTQDDQGKFTFKYDIVPSMMAP